MANIKMTNSGKTYAIQAKARELNRMVGHDLFVKFSEDVVAVSDDDLENIRSKSNGRLYQMKSANDATDAQMRYLASLGVDTRGSQLTKSQASQLITAAKSGDGVGSLGFDFMDGSN